MGWNEGIKKALSYCGNQVFIGHNVIFTNPSEIILHDRVRIDPFCLITTALEVGSNCHICAYSLLGGGSSQKIILDGWNFIGYGSKLFTATEDYSGDDGAVCEWWGSNKIYRGDIRFKKFAGVASDVIMFPDIILPVGCTIGAKSLVHTKDKRKLKSWSVFYGSPIKFQKGRNSEQITKLAEDPDWLKEH